MTGLEEAGPSARSAVTRRGCAGEGAPWLVHASARPHRVVVGKKHGVDPIAVLALQVPLGDAELVPANLCTRARRKEGRGGWGASRCLPHGRSTGPPSAPATRAAPGRPDLHDLVDEFIPLLSVHLRTEFVGSCMFTTFLRTRRLSLPSRKGATRQDRTSTD